MTRTLLHALLLVAVLLLFAAPVAHAQSHPPTNCLYPSVHKRFNLTISHRGPNTGLYAFDVSALAPGGYMEWGVRADPVRPLGMDYYPLIHVDEHNAAWQPYGYHPSGAVLEDMVRANLGATWLIGNEADYRWHGDHASPEAYARIYHDVYAAIKAIDPSAKIASNGLATVSSLRLAWLGQVWDAYRARYGAPMPVDVWTVHSYTVNEMVHEWGPDLPSGIDNAVGYYSSGSWQLSNVAGGSDSTVHESNVLGARAYFAFAGNEATLLLRTGPDAGIADIYRDKILVDTVDLYTLEPGVLSLSYSGLPQSPDPHLGMRHHLRVQVTGQRNPASSGQWIRVDALEAASTAALPGGRLENDFPLQARIIVSPDDYDNLDLLVAQLRMMREWMAERGQQDKPLINTEFGVLMGENVGFTYERARDFMLNSFDLFLNSPDLVDPEIGMPQDDGRLLQQWFWFILSLRTFNGTTVYTGLMDESSGGLTALGQDYAAYVQDLVQNYIDLETTYLELSPAWPLFANEQALIEASANVHNRGNLAAGAFRIQLSQDGETLRQWQVPGLSVNGAGNDLVQVQHSWQTLVAADRLVTLSADSAGQIGEPCDANNSFSQVLRPTNSTDLALSGLSASPPYPTSNTQSIRLRVLLSNLGSSGTAAQHVDVKFWDGAPESGGNLLYTKTFLPGDNLTTVTATFDWFGFGSGQHDIIAEVTQVAEDSNSANNRQQISVWVPVGDNFIHLPVLKVAGASRQARTLLEWPDSDKRWGPMLPE